MSVKITYFVHGTTTDNEKNLATGWVPGELSELGITRVKKLKEVIKDKRFDAVFCSDLKRAVDSATILFSDQHKIIQDERLREANYGDHTQKNADLFKSNMEDFIDSPFPNGESYRDVEKRIASFCDYLKDNYQDKHIAIIAHQAPQLVLDVILKNKTWEQAINEDWRKTKTWQPGWEYIIN